MIETSANNKRIAKNTLLLYFRTLFIMLVTLYTSRVVLNTLGVTDYGIYNVVGGVVMMFSVISGSLSSSISRIQHQRKHTDRYFDSHTCIGGIIRRMVFECENEHTCRAVVCCKLGVAMFATVIHNQPDKCPL